MINNMYSRRSIYDPLIPVMGLLPLLVGITDARTGLVMGSICLVTLITTTLITGLSARMLPVELRLAIIVILCATVVSIIHLLLQSYAYGLVHELGIYIPLIAANCLLIGWIQQYTFDRSLKAVFILSVQAGIIILGVCILFGLVRAWIDLPVIREAAGVFLFIALLLALQNAIVLHRKQHQSG